MSDQVYMLNVDNWNVKLVHGVAPPTIEKNGDRTTMSCDIQFTFKHEPPLKEGDPVTVSCGGTVFGTVTAIGVSRENHRLTYTPGTPEEWLALGFDHTPTPLWLPMMRRAVFGME